MPKANIKGNYVTLGCLMSLTAVAHAASFNGNASVSILNSFEFVEQKVVDFGAITQGDGACSMGPTGALEASNGGTCAGEGQLGEILISGTADQTISVSVEVGDSAPGLTFTPQLHSASSVVLVGGQTTAKIGGLLTLSGVAAGSYNLTYVVIVNYN